MASKRQLLEQPKPRRFQLYRREDVNGASGTGIVAEGIEYRDGTVAYNWLTEPSTHQIADAIEDVQHIHGHNGRTTVRWLDDADPPGEEKTLQEVYEDRNRLAVAFAALAHQHPGPEYAGGWHADPGDDADADEWAICWATLPAVGQVSWHVPVELARRSALQEHALEFDGHTREEKNNRLTRFSGP